jgi:nucleoside-diphosphate-sugar epimerase
MQTGDPTTPGGKVGFVTGGTGFLGLNLVERLTADGWRVVALHRATSDLTYLKRFRVELVEGSIEDARSLEKAVPAKIDVIYHVAGDVSFWSRHRERQTRTNIEGTRNVVAAALGRGSKLIHTSTTSVYGFPPGSFDETAPHLGRDSWFHYMHTKAVAEEIVREGIARGLDAVMLNPANIIGPYDKHNWARLILLAVAGKLPRIPPGRGTFCHAVEVAKAHIAAAERGRTGENYILGGADASFADLVRTIGEVVGRRVPTRTMRPRFMRSAGRVLGWVSAVTGREPVVTPESAAFLCADLTCKSDKAVRELGYSPATLQSMVADCYRWLIAEGFLAGASPPVSTPTPTSGGRRGDG